MIFSFIDTVKKIQLNFIHINFQIYKFLIVLIFHNSFDFFLFLQEIMMYILNIENAKKNDGERYYRTYI